MEEGEVASGCGLKGGMVVGMLQRREWDDVEKVNIWCIGNGDTDEGNFVH